MNRLLQITLFTTALLLGSAASQVMAQLQNNWTGAANNNDWNTIGNWSLNRAPLNTDIVTIDLKNVDGNRVININVNAVCGSLTWVNTGASTATASVSGTNSLTIGSLTVDGSLTLLPAVNLTNYTGSVTFNSTGTGSITSAGKTLYNVTFNSGTYNLQDDLSVNGNLTIAGATLNSNNRNISLTGNWSSSTGTFNAGTGTVTFSGGTGSASISTNSSFNNLNISKSINQSNPLSLTGSFSMSSGTFTTNGHNISLAGDWNATGGTFTHGNNTVTITGGTAPSQLRGTGFHNLVINKDVNLAGAISLANDLTLASGTFNAGAHAITIGRDILSNGGSFTQSGNLVTFNGTAPITLPSLTFHSISIEKFDTTNVALAGPLTLTGNLGFTGGKFTSNGYTIELDGNWSMTGGTFVHGDNTVTFRNGTATSQLRGTGAFFNLVMNRPVSLTGPISVANQLTSNGSTFTHNNHNVTFSGSSSIVIPAISFHSITVAKTDPAASIELSAPLVLNGGLSISGGIVNTNNHNITLGSSLSMTGGSFLPGSNTVTFSGGTPSISLTNSSTFNNLIITSGATATLASPITVSGNVTISTGTLNAGANTITVAGNWSSSGTFNAGTGTVIFNGLTSTINTNSAFNHLTINAGTTVGLSSAITINGNLNLAGTLNANGYTITLGGQWQANGGSFNHGNNTVVFTGNNSMDLPSATFHSVTVAKTGTNSVRLTESISLTGSLTISGGILNANGHDITLSGNFTSNNTGSFTAGTGTVIFNGLTSSITTNSAFNHLTINAGTTVGLSSAITINGNLNLAGTLNANGYTITLGGQWQANGGSFNHGNNTVVFTGSTSFNLPAATFHNLTVDKAASSTVTLTQSLSLSGNLTINSGTLTAGSNSITAANLSVAGGTLNANSTVTLSGAVTITAGTLNATNSNITLAGNWSMNGGTFTSTGSTVTMQGGANATISSTSTGAFNNLVVNKTVGLSSPITVNRNLTIAGSLSDNGNLLTGNTTGTMRMTGTATLTLTNNVATPNSAMPQFASYNLDPTTTVTYGAGTLGIRSLTTTNGTGYGNLIIAGTNTKTLTGNITIQGDLNIQTGSTLAQNNQNIDIQGNWTGAGAFTASAGASRVTFYGSANSTISSTLTFHNLVINKSAKANTVNITSPVVIAANGTMTFNMGIVNTTLTYDQNNPLLEFKNGAQAIGASHNSHVSGYIRKRGMENFTFPIGNGLFYRPAGILPQPDKAEYGYDARYINRLYPTVNNDYSPSRVSTAGLSVSEYEYWHIQLLPGADSSPRITLSLEMPISAGGTLENNNINYNYYGDDSRMLTVAVWQGTNSSGSWSDNGNNTATAFNPKTTAGVINAQSSTNTNKTHWAIASTYFALPIDLMYFRATAAENTVVLDWATAAEINNDYFTVEKSADGKNFTAVATVNGKGNSKEVNKYTSVDYAPYNGVTYYRLKQTDFDGKYTYSKTVAVQLSMVSNSLQVYASGARQVQVKYSVTAEENGVLTIHDSRGVQVWAKQVRGGIEEVQEQVNMQSAAGGLYIVSLQMPSGTIVKKVLMF